MKPITIALILVNKSFLQMEQEMKTKTTPNNSGKTAGGGVGVNML